MADAARCYIRNDPDREHRAEYRSATYISSGSVRKFSAHRPFQDGPLGFGVIEPLVEGTPRTVVLPQTQFGHVDGTVENVATEPRVAGKRSSPLSEGRLHCDHLLAGWIDLPWVTKLIA